MIFSRPPILLSIGQFLDSNELCYYSKISTAIHAIWCYHHSPYSKFFITQACNERKKFFSGTIKCNVTDNGLKFEWKCTKKEYEHLLTEYNSDQFIECLPFEEPKTKTKWFIEIFPNGYHLSKNGYGALFLTMEWKPKDIKEVRARLLCNCPQVNLKFSDGVTYDWRKFSKGKHNAFQINDVLANESITLSVELIIIDVTENETRINSEIKEQMDNMHNKMLQLQSRMDEMDSIQNRLFHIDKLLNKLITYQQIQYDKQENIEHNKQIESKSMIVSNQHYSNHSSSSTSSTSHCCCVYDKCIRHDIVIDKYNDDSNHSHHCIHDHVSSSSSSSYHNYPHLYNYDSNNSNNSNHSSINGKKEQDQVIHINNMKNTREKCIL